MIQRDRPLFEAVGATGPREPGLHLLDIEASIAAEDVAAVACGRLIVPCAAGPVAALAYLRALSVTVVSERDQAVFAARIIARQPLVSTLPPLTDDPNLCGVDFRFDLETQMGYPLWAERFFVFLGACELAAEPAVYEHKPAGDGPTTEVLVRGLPLAYASLRVGNLEYALRQFRAALVDAQVATDLDGAHRYHAACTACRLAEQRRANGKDDAELVAAAMNWLDEDSVALAAAWDRLVELRDNASEAGEERLRARQIDELRARVAWMRLGDPDLERLRGELKIDPRLRQAGVLERIG